METKLENVAVVYDNNKKVVGIIHRDEKTGHKLLYSCEQMSIDEISRLINQEKPAV